MGNFKVKVNNEAESREVQELLFSIGRTHDDGSKDHYQFCFGKYPQFINCEDEYISASRTGYLSYDETTLAELRAMVKPSLNDQYAEIEKVRQHKKHERNSSAWDIQIGGDHYKQFHIQPMQFALENKLDAAQQNVIKYIMRHSFKNGKQDLEKAKHYIDLMIEFYYGENNNG